jgi:hypothetical protein
LITKTPSQTSCRTGTPTTVCISIANICACPRAELHLSIVGSNDLSASDPTSKTGAHVPEFRQNREQDAQAYQGDNSQSAPTRSGDYGSSGYPGNTTNVETVGPRGDAFSGSGEYDTRRTGGPVSGGDFSQSTTDSQGGFGSTGYPGNTTTADNVGGTGGAESTGKPGFTDRVFGNVEALLRYNIVLTSA